MVQAWKKPIAGIAVAAIAASSGATQAQDRTSDLDPAAMARVGQVDERYQSYNVEMLEVTGGSFWKPYSASNQPSSSASSSQSGAQAQGGGESAPSGMDPDLYQYRPPIDLTNRRLRAMAGALGPAYMRISGTWANTTYFADTDTPPRTPPQGFNGVLTRQQWLGAIDFSRAVNAPIVTSMPLSQGTRDANDVWQPDQARRWLAFTKANGGTIAAAEYFNEPTLASMGGAPQGYDAADFGRDFKIYEAFMRKEFPGIKLLGPGSVGEADADWAVASGGYGNFEILRGEDLAKYTGGADAFSYHHYGAVSLRCKQMGHQTTADEALTEDWLSRTDKTLSYYRRARDQSMPGKPFWNTETADAACGGNPWAGTFLDNFRYVDQLGRLALQGVTVHMHNTLVASDYGMLDENDFSPKPKFWAALLWRRLMGTTVLDAGTASGPGLHVYAHCMRDEPGGVAMIVINTDSQNSRSLSVPAAGQRYTLTAASLTDKTVMLNGIPLQLGAGDALPAMAGQAAAAGDLAFGPTSITFLALPSVQNQACQ